MTKIYVFIIFLFSAFSLSAQDGIDIFMSKHVNNFTENEYGENYNAQNWSITQDNDGLIYFGNSNFVLTYDGIHWNSIPVSTNSSYITSLLAANNGNVYWGCNGDLGVIETNEIGKQTSKSLLSKIPELDRYFSRVWRIYNYKNRIVFFSQETIFLYDPNLDSMEVVYPQESFHLAFVSNDELYVRDRSYGLRKFNGKEFQDIKGGDVFHNEGIFGLIPISDERQLIITQVIGLYIYDSKNTENPISKLNSPDIETLNKQQIIGSTMLHDGNIALNTASNGVIIINEKGIIIHRINLASGIADNDVKQVYQDKYDNLWLATTNGISQVSYSSPISLFLQSEKSGLYGSVNALAMVGNRLFAGTTTGLFTFSNSPNQFFEIVEGLSNNIKTLLAVNNDLYIGTSSSLYVYHNHSINKLTSMDVSGILYSTKNNRLYVFGENGLSIFQTYPSWKTLLHDDEITLSSIGALLQTNKSNVDHLWIGTFKKGLWHLTVNSNIEDKISKEIYAEADNLPSDWVKPFLYDNSLFAGTSEGLYRMEDIEDAPADSSGKTDYKSYFIPAKLPSLDSGIVTFLQNINENYYAVYNGIVAKKEGDKSFDETPFLSLNIGKINALTPEDNNIIWVGANGGIAKIDLNKHKNYMQKPDIKIRVSNLGKDSVLFYKASNKTNYKLDYQYNSFNITYSSLYQENGKQPLFSYKLESYDNEWSPWSMETTARFKKLKEGNYVFKVKSKNIYNIESDIEEINILIAAPWYRTLWAYLAYFIFAIAVIIMIVRAYTYRLKQKNIQLEAIIVERTKEIVKQKNEIETQRDHIKEVHEEIKSSIEYAKRIQTAVLPHQEFSHPVIKDYFILFKPKDVVSGDFYWAKQSGNHLVIAVADCTGHGVPGAFMSMLGISLLNEIVGKEQEVEAASILNHLRAGVVRSLKQNEDNKESANVMDGMDISLTSINLETGELQWAGAHNPLFIISDTKPIFSEETNIRIHRNENSTHQLYDIKADKMPIAISGKMTPFTNHKFQLKSGDSIFMFSDGFIDQFGGPKGKKFMIKAFRNMLISNSALPMKKQMQNYEEELNNWISYIDDDTQLPFTQIDDICLIGVRF